MHRRFAWLFTLTLLISAPPAAPVHPDLDGLIAPAEVDCLLRAPEDGVRWVWDGSYCVGLIVGRLEE
jgi:hypothetical protein